MHYKFGGQNYLGKESENDKIGQNNDQILKNTDQIPIKLVKHFAIA